jgi:hypothetical protein
MLLYQMSGNVTELGRKVLMNKQRVHLLRLPITREARTPFELPHGICTCLVLFVSAATQSHGDLILRLQVSVSLTGVAVLGVVLTDRLE